VAHPAGVADRIDRSFAPRGEREERDLVNLFNESSSPKLQVKRILHETRVHGDYCIPRRWPPFRACLDDTFSF